MNPVGYLQRGVQPQEASLGNGVGVGGPQSFLYFNLKTIRKILIFTASNVRGPIAGASPIVDLHHTATYFNLPEPSYVDLQITEF